MSDEPLHPLQLWHCAWLGDGAMLSHFADVSAKEKSRCRFDSDHAQLPQSWLDGDTTLARAALTHIATHRRFGSPRFDPGSLRPVQIALVALFEDARVEQLAMARRPGLRRLWQPFITGSNGIAAVDLLARLTQALFDATHVDDHHWVTKGQRLFFAQRMRWHDPLLSRELGSLLGNDLGQMRLQFNWKDHVVAPRYRDDGHGLWLFPPADDEPPRELQSLGGGATPTPAVANDSGNDGSEESEPATSPAWQQPEWDYRIRRLRPDWVTLRHQQPQRGDATALSQWLAQQRSTLQPLRRAMAMREASLRRQSRQPSGDQLDLDAAIAATIDRRSSTLPDHRLYRGRLRREQPRALLLLLDASQSSADPIAGGELPLLEIERRAAALLAEVGALRGDQVALLAFRSNGRGDVRLELLQPFGARDAQLRLQRLAGLQAGLSTRLGAALRATQPLFAQALRQSGNGWLIAISDGEPSDIDNSDSRYLIEDARRAVGELRRSGVRCTALGLETAQPSALATIFGQRFTRTLTRAERLPQQLQQLYRLLR